MVILGLFLDKADELKMLPSGAREISELASFYSGTEFKERITEIFENWRFFSVAHGQFLTGILSVLQEKKRFMNVSILQEMARKYDEKYSVFSHVMEEKYRNVIDSYWQQEFLFYGFPFCLKGSFLHNYFAYVIAYKIWEMYLYGYLEGFDGEIKKEKLLDLVARYSKKLDHIDKYLENLIEYTANFEKEPLKFMQVLLKLA